MCGEAKFLRTILSISTSEELYMGLGEIAGSARQRQEPGEERERVRLAAINFNNARPGQTANLFAEHTLLICR